MAKATKIEVTFQLDESTKNAHRYKELDDKGAVLPTNQSKIGTLYVRKSVIGDNPPKTA